MKIICLGDSLTEGCGLRRGENWVELLQTQTTDERINAGVKPVVGIPFPVLGIPDPWRAVCDWESGLYTAWLRRLVRAVSLRHIGLRRGI